MSPNPWELIDSHGFPFCSKASPLSLFKNILTYHFVVLYLVNQHYGFFNLPIMLLPLYGPWETATSQGSFLFPRQARKLILDFLFGLQRLARGVFLKSISTYHIVIFRLTHKPTYYTFIKRTVSEVHFPSPIIF
jgi:hypothetical protein